MTVKRDTQFVDDIDRYAFDLGFCSYAKGWAQIDTKQDASYYGNWCNPALRRIVSYAEGDMTIIKCDTDDEFVSEMKNLALFHADNGYWLGIDPGFSDLLKRRFEDLGLGDLLH